MVTIGLPNLADSSPSIAKEFRIQVAWGNIKAIPPPRPDMLFLKRTNEESIWVAEENDQIWFWRPGVSLVVNLASGEGLAKIIDTSGWLEVMLVLYFHKFLKAKGILLHASGIIREGKAYLFPGPSGAGKSTIADLSPENQVLHEDTTGVLLDGEARPLACSLPLLAYGRRQKKMVCRPLKGLYFPFKSQENRLVPLTPRESLVRLLPNVRSFTNWIPRRQKLFDLAGQLVERVPGFALYFRPVPSFWQVIDES